MLTFRPLLLETTSCDGCGAVAIAGIMTIPIAVTVNPSNICVRLPIANIMLICPSFRQLWQIYLNEICHDRGADLNYFSAAGSRWGLLDLSLNNYVTWASCHRRLSDFFSQQLLQHLIPIELCSFHQNSCSGKYWQMTRLLALK